MLNVGVLRSDTETAPMGEMVPNESAVAVMVWVTSSPIAKSPNDVKNKPCVLVAVLVPGVQTDQLGALYFRTS